MKINMKKLAQYLKEGKILEFNSDKECMEFFNTFEDYGYEKGIDVYNDAKKDNVVVEVDFY